MQKRLSKLHTKTGRRAQASPLLALLCYRATCWLEPGLDAFATQLYFRVMRQIPANHSSRPVLHSRMRRTPQMLNLEVVAAYSKCVTLQQIQWHIMTWAIFTMRWLKQLSALRTVVSSVLHRLCGICTVYESVHTHEHDGRGAETFDAMSLTTKKTNMCGLTRYDWQEPNLLFEACFTLRWHSSSFVIGDA